MNVAMTLDLTISTVKEMTAELVKTFCRIVQTPTTVAVVVIEGVHGRMGVPPMIGEQFSIQNICVRFLETYTMAGRSKFLESLILQFG